MSVNGLLNGGVCCCSMASDSGLHLKSLFMQYIEVSFPSLISYAIVSIMIWIVEFSFTREQILQSIAIIPISVAVNTKVDMRFNVKNAHWLSERVRERIFQMVMDLSNLLVVSVSYNCTIDSVFLSKGP